MKKQVITIALTLFAPASIAANACYIDGKTVFQKEPCPVQEAQNLSGAMSQKREYQEDMDNRISQSYGKRRPRVDYANRYREALDSYRQDSDASHRERMRDYERMQKKRTRDFNRRWRSIN